MVTIWFEPHCTTLDNEAGLASGWNDVDLSELGLRQSVELTERCRNRNLSAIFCSDSQRAVKSAIPTAEALHLPIYVDRRLRECNYGDLTLKPKGVVEAERINRIKTPFLNGESYEQAVGRVGACITEIKKAFDNKVVMVIGSRATHYGIEHIALGKPIEQCVSEKWSWQPGWEYQVQ